MENVEPILSTDAQKTIYSKINNIDRGADTETREFEKTDRTIESPKRI